MDITKEKEDKEAAKQILAIIQQEKDKSSWRRMSYSLGKPRGDACFKVQVKQADGAVQEFSGQDNLQGAIWSNIHEKCFHLAKLAQQCSGSLQGTFGYNAICQTSNEILEGMYKFPPKFDQATKEILQECAAIRLKIPKSLVNTMITKKDWDYHWSRAKEETSSSLSRRHFGHYKAGLRSDYIKYLQALIATLTTRWEIVLNHWSQGLSAKLEKIFECSLITKLRSILLIEADFNAANKTIYGIQMLANAR